MEISQKDNYNDLKKNFLNIKNEYRPVPFYHMDGDISDGEVIGAQFSAFKKCGYGGVALLPVSETVPEFGSEEYYRAYKEVLDRAEKLGLSVIYYDDLDFPSGWAGGMLAQKYPAALAKQLCRRLFACTSGERSRFKLSAEGETVSVVALEDDTKDVIDLRDYIENGYVVWDTPEGNWTVQQYFVAPIKEAKYVNYLDYDACRLFIELTYKVFADRFCDYIGKTVFLTFYDDIQYNAPNRRMWDANFNKIFTERFGFDPAPYYPAMYEEINEDTGHFKALFMNCRAAMLSDGFFKAVSDFTKSRGLICTGHVAEAKSTSAPWLFGDGMTYQKYSGACGLDLVHKYLYGTNGLKLASSAAYNYGKSLVCCEIFGNYAALNEDIMYREAMNAFSRGVNYLIPHTLWYSGNARIPHEVSHRNPLFRDVIRDWNDFAARAQALLRGGRHICDIALIYPIYSLQAQTSLYESAASGFEFPQTPVNADYMNIINIVINYCGYDLTVMHPEVLETKCHTDSGELFFGGDGSFEQYKIVILPGSLYIGVKTARLLKKFFCEGGVIIATDVLPFKAFEFNPEKKENGVGAFDAEVEQIVEYVFGVKKDEINAFESYYSNTSPAGGKAFYILPSKTAADGTDLIDSSVISAILDERAETAHDVIIENMPRIQNSGILSLALPMYEKMDVMAASGGMFNHIHIKNGVCDIYYFSNSTNRLYEGTAALRGLYTQCEEWNPHTGKIKKLALETQTRRGEDYTVLPLTLGSARSVFIVCRE